MSHIKRFNFILRGCCFSMNDVKKLNILILISPLFVTALSVLGLINLIPGFVLREILVELLVNLSILYFVILYLKAKKQGAYPEAGPIYKDLLRINKITLKDLLCTVLLCISFPPVLTFVNLFSQLFTVNSVNDTIFTMWEKSGLVESFLVLGVFPAALEELVNRGIIQSVYKKVNVLGSILIGSLVFALSHGNLNQFMYALVAGFFFALLTEASDSIIPSFIVHMWVNGSSVIDAFRYLSELTSADYTPTSLGTGNAASLLPTYLGLALFGIAVSFLLLFCIAKNHGRWNIIKDAFVYRYDTESVPGTMPMRRLFTWPLTAFVIIEAASIVFTELMIRGILKM